MSVDFVIFIFCFIQWYLLHFYLLRRSTDEVTAPRKGADFRDFPLTMIIVLVRLVKLNTYHGVNLGLVT